MPKVSIIVPNYNYRQYLPERLASITGQTFTDYELILLDDKSTDGSGEYLREFAKNNKNKVKACVINDRNTGNPFVQWQKGIDMAEGEYVWIAESDDCCSNDLLQRLVPLLDADEKAVFAMCGSHLVDENGNGIDKNYDTWKDDDDNAFVYDSESYIKHFLLWRCTSYNASMIVFRRSTCLSIRHDFAALRYSGDWLFWIKMAEKGDVIVLHKRMNLFRRHSTSVTAKASGSEKQLQERLYIYAYLFGHHRFGTYRTLLAKGGLYKAIKRANTNGSAKKAMLADMQGVNRAAYAMERTMKVLHSVFRFIPIARHDDVKGRQIKP